MRSTAQRKAIKQQKIYRYAREYEEVHLKSNSVSLMEERSSNVGQKQP